MMLLSDSSSPIPLLLSPAFSSPSESDQFWSVDDGHGKPPLETKETLNLLLFYTHTQVCVYARV